MNLRPGSLPRSLVCHSRSCGFLDFLTDDGVLHYGVAEVIHHRSDGEDAAHQPLVQTFLYRGRYPVRKGRGGETCARADERQTLQGLSARERH